MAKQLISRRTMNEFREFFVTYHVARTIQSEFEAADITCHPPEGLTLPGGVRRSMVEQYYASLDLTNRLDVEKLIKVYENVLLSIEPSQPEVVQRLVKWLEKDGYVRKGARIEAAVGPSKVIEIRELAEKFDSDVLRTLAKRIEAGLEDDPASAIGQAKELVETACETILSERKVERGRNWDFPQLVRETAGVLQLTPHDVSESKKGAESIKKVLGNLTAMAGGLAEIRNLYGTGHGKNVKAKGLSSRHAKLATGCAVTLAVFLFETHEDRGTT